MVNFRTGFAAPRPTSTSTIAPQKAPKSVTAHFKPKTTDMRQSDDEGKYRCLLPGLDEITWGPCLLSG